MLAGKRAKAQRGELALQLPVGLVREPHGTVVKDPDREVQERIALVFGTFLRVYLLKLGFLDGAAGFMLAVANAEGAYYRYQKAWLARQRRG